jgi:hypothetical protein
MVKRLLAANKDEVLPLPRPGWTELAMAAVGTNDWNRGRRKPL